MRLSRLAFCAALALAPDAASADVVTVVADKDGTLYETVDGAVANAQGQYFFAGRNFSGQYRRALISFDLAGVIPVGSTVNSASLELFMSKTTASTQPVALHRSLAEWGEATSMAFGEEGGGAAAVDGDATWIHRFRPATFWATAGGDFAALSSAQTPVAGAGTYQWAGLSADVQSWVDAPANNFGWFVLGGENSSGSAKRFDTKENSDPSHWPMLTISFDPPANVYPSFCFGDGGDQAGCADCPCGNNTPSAGSGGCLNISGSSATLSASGVPSLTADSLRFTLAGANPSTLTLLISGDSQAPAAAANPCFGMASGIVLPGLNGLRCVVTNFRRHGGRMTDTSGSVGASTAGWGTPDGPAGGLISAGGFTSGQTRHFQVIYRELPFAVCLQNLNTSQGVSATFVP